jgi:hypothetical protein
MVKWHELIEFLRCVSKMRLSAEDKEFILRFSQREAPWQSIAALAEMEGVAGLVYYQLKDLCLLGRLPASFTRQIENSYRQARETTVTVIDEAKALSKRLEQRGIPVVALQGLSLLSIYKDPGLRPLSDVDLMIERNHKEALTALLREEGYHNPIVTHPDIFYRDGIKIDIHTHVLNLDRIQTRSYLFPEDLASMWERAVPIFDQTHGILVLDPIDNFIALAAHALKHCYSRLIWMVDLHELMLEWGSTINTWKEMVERARFWRQKRVVLYALVLMEKMFHQKIPLWVEGNLGSKTLNTLEKYLLRLKLEGFSSGELSTALWLFNISGVTKKLKFMRETIFPSKEIMPQLFPQSPWEKKRIIYAHRLARAVASLGKSMGKALAFSVWSGSNR